MNYSLTKLSPARRRVLVIAGALLLLALLLRLGLFWSHIKAPLALDERHYLLIDSGTNLTRVLHQLEQEGILPDAGDLLLFAKLSGGAASIKAGEYELQAGLSAAGLLDLLASGRVVYHQVRIGEGWTLRQAIEVIQDHQAVAVTLDASDPESIQRIFNLGYYPEGMFFPDTYNFTRGTTDLELLQRAFSLMEQKLEQHWQARAVGLPYESRYDALIMASIIEKETALASEQQQIAGVFIRRLQRNMRLQTDPSVIYGMGRDFNGDLTRGNLTTDSPWNTYTRHGLPLTPIALPGEGAIAAAMHPDDSDNVYFVSRGDGSHHFSATLAEHNQAVRRYQLDKQAP